MSEIPSASQIMAALIKRLGGGPVVLTYAEVMAFETKWPTKLESDEDGVSQAAPLPGSVVTLASRAVSHALACDTT